MEDMLHLMVRDTLKKMTDQSVKTDMFIESKS